jgi:hypothetical protein
MICGEQAQHRLGCAHVAGKDQSVCHVGLLSGWAVARGQGASQILPTHQHEALLA